MWHDGADGGGRREIGAGSALPRGAKERRDEESADHGKKHLETHPDHKDVFVCIRDAFSAAQRQLEDHVRLLRGEVRHHWETVALPDDALS